MHIDKTSRTNFAAVSNILLGPKSKILSIKLWKESNSVPAKKIIMQAKEITISTPAIRKITLIFDVFQIGFFFRYFAVDVMKVNNARIIATYTARIQMLSIT